MRSSSRHRNKNTTMPFIMPDGRPLGAYLNLSESRGETHKGKRRHHKEHKKAMKSGWTSQVNSKCSVSLGNTISPASYLVSHLDDEELDSLNKLGQRKQRRWKNELLLRAMAPELTADAIDGLFKPVPFGDIHPPSPFTQISHDEDLQQLWQLLLSVSAEKQQRILEKWDTHVKELLQSCQVEHKDGQSKALIANGYSRRWQQKVSAIGKTALKKAPTQTLHDIEAKMIPCIFTPGMSVDIHAEDGFGRLLAHSIAQFHGLRSISQSHSGKDRFVHISGSDANLAEMSSTYIGIADFVFATTGNALSMGNLVDLQRHFTGNESAI